MSDEPISWLASPVPAVRGLKVKVEHVAPPTPIQLPRGRAVCWEGNLFVAQWNGGPLILAASAGGVLYSLQPWVWLGLITQQDADRHQEWEEQGESARAQTEDRIRVAHDLTIIGEPVPAGLKRKIRAAKNVIKGLSADYQQMAKRVMR